MDQMSCSPHCIFSDHYSSTDSCLHRYMYPTTGTYTIEYQILIIAQNAFTIYIVLYSTVLFPWWSFKKMKDNKEDDKDKMKREYRRVTGTATPT